jgi:hypothetical protein
VKFRPTDSVEFSTDSLAPLLSAGGAATGATGNSTFCLGFMAAVLFVSHTQ